jgi:hypothetical protein
MVQTLSRDIFMEDKTTTVDIAILCELKDVYISKMRDQLKDDLYHFDLKSKHTGTRGLGCDAKEEIAYLKAQNELIERLVYRFEKTKNPLKSSSGFAAHSTLDNCKLSAFNELLERDLFLTSWFSGSYPNWDLSDMNINFEYLKEQIDLFKSFDFGLKVGHIGNCGETHCLTAVLFDVKNRFSGLFAASADKNPNTALKKVIMDMRRIGTYLINTIREGTPLFSEVVNFTETTDHQDYFLHNNRRDLIHNYLNTNGKAIELTPINPSYKRFVLPIEISSRIEVVQCSSPNVQNYFIGTNMEENINFSRLKEVGFLDLTRKVHPFG